MESPIVKVLLIIFAIIGAVAVLGFLGMWFMHGSMMGMMSMIGSHENMAAMCRGMLTAFPSG